MRAIGSSYLIRQIAGSEKVGGLQVTIRPKRGTTGEITVVLTDWRTNQPINLSDDYIAPAIAGIHEVSAMHENPLAAFDVELSAFLYHDTDSDPRCFRQYAKSAFRAALEAWKSGDLQA